jgi:hypothetical protein
MNLQTFNATTMPNERQSNTSPKISITPKGVFSLNRKASELIKLSEKDKVGISQDADDPVNWYVHKDAEGFNLRSLNEANGSLGFNNVSLKNAMFEAMELQPDKTKQCIISKQCTKVGKVELWPIIFIG